MADDLEVPQYQEGQTAGGGRYVFQSGQWHDNGPSSTLGDVVQAAPGIVARGATAAMTAQPTVGKMMAEGALKAVTRAPIGYQWLAHKFLPESVSEATREPIANYEQWLKNSEAKAALPENKMPFTGGDYGSTVDAIESGVSKATGQPYQLPTAKTPGGKVVQAVGETIPGLGRNIPSMLKGSLAAAGGELTSQGLEGYKFPDWIPGIGGMGLPEPVGRALGSIGAAAVPQGVRRLATPNPITDLGQVARNRVIGQTGITQSAGQQTGGGIARGIENNLVTSLPANSPFRPENQVRQIANAQANPPARYQRPGGRFGTPAQFQSDLQDATSRNRIGAPVGDTANRLLPLLSWAGGTAVAHHLGLPLTGASEVAGLPALLAGPEALRATVMRPVASAVFSPRGQQYLGNQRFMPGPATSGMDRELMTRLLLQQGAPQAQAAVGQ